MMNISKKPSNNIFLSLPESKKKELLFRYCGNGDINKLKKLLYSGVNINSKNSYNITPLHLSASANNLKISSILINFGANVNAQNVLGSTPLLLAIRKPDLDIDFIEFLLDSGANPNIQDKGKNTILNNYLIEQRHAFNPDVVKLLIKYDADPTIKNIQEDNSIDTLKQIITNTEKTIKYSPIDSYVNMRKKDLKQYYKILDTFYKVGRK